MVCGQLPLLLERVLILKSAAMQAVAFSCQGVQRREQEDMGALLHLAGTGGAHWMCYRGLLCVSFEGAVSILLGRTSQSTAKPSGQLMTVSNRNLHRTPGVCTPGSYVAAVLPWLLQCDPGFSCVQQGRLRMSRGSVA